MWSSQPGPWAPVTPYALSNRAHKSPSGMIRATHSSDWKLQAHPNVNKKAAGLSIQE